MSDNDEAILKIGENLPTVPTIKVIENGKPSNTIDPAVMQFVMQASIAAQAVRIRKYFDNKKSQGWKEDFALAVTPQPQEVLCSRPAQTFYCINDSPLPPAPPVAIFISLNSPHGTWSSLNPGEDMFIDYETHELDYFYIFCTAGAVAPARALVTG